MLPSSHPKITHGQVSPACHTHRRPTTQNCETRGWNLAFPRAEGDREGRYGERAAILRPAPPRGAIAGPNRPAQAAPLALCARGPATTGGAVIEWPTRRQAV